MRLKSRTRHGVPSGGGVKGQKRKLLHTHKVVRERRGWVAQFRHALPTFQSPHHSGQQGRKAHVQRTRDGGPLVHVGESHTCPSLPTSQPTYTIAPSQSYGDIPSAAQ